MAPGKDQIVLQASDSLKEALGEYAQANNLHMAEVIRQAIAEKIGYDYANEPARGRTRVYASEADRKRAGLERATLLRWGLKTSSKLLGDGEIEAATVIARAVASHDYDSLEALKIAADAVTNEETAE